MLPVRVRFAPSPTGYLHVGGARTLLYNYLFARLHGGSLVLRIEDTDQARSTSESEEMILSDIRSLGLDWQEGPTAQTSSHQVSQGTFGPYRQSERLGIYASCLKELRSRGLAYPCFCTEPVLKEKRSQALKLGQSPHYDGTCRELPEKDVERRLAAGELAAMRFRAPAKTFIVKDHVRGDVEFKPGVVGDFFISRSPKVGEKEVAAGLGFPVYNFCCAIDDHLMQISHVIRAEEHLSNTLRQLMIYDAFAWAPPQYAHIALVLGADRQKLSKRSGDVSVHDYLNKGYLPQALLNFLSLIGWWPPADFKPSSGHPEVLTLGELISVFSLEGLQKASAVFDLVKLNWMNAYYIQHAEGGELVRLVRPFFERAGSRFARTEDSELAQILLAVRSEVRLLSDFPNVVASFFGDSPHLESSALSVLQEPSSINTVVKIIEALLLELGSSSGTLLAGEVENLPKKIALATGTKGKALYQPIRAAITGKIHGPELKHILPLMGRERVLRRIGEIRALAGV